MKRLTKNRIEIMQALTEEHHDCGLAPYSVSSIHYMLYGIDLDTPRPQRDKIEKTRHNQIRRTLNDLANEGLVIMGRELHEGYNGSLPYWGKVYQIAAMAEHNHFEQDLHDIERTISRAYNGFGALFGGKPDGKGLNADEIAGLTKRVKGVI